MKTEKLTILEDDLNQLVYLLKDWPYCCITQETVDLTREVIRELITEKTIAEQDNIANWNWEHLL